MQHEHRNTLEYIWIDGNGELRSKTMIFRYHGLGKLNASTCPEWNYDGSSTGQASGNDSEVVLKPVAVFDDPFRNANSYLVLCATYKPSGEPLETNNWIYADNIFDSRVIAEYEPWYGLEQEYFIINPKTKRPLGCEDWSKTTQSDQHYCGVGANNAFGRKIAEEHLQLCLKINLKISGINAEVAPGQWEFQVGPCTGIQAGDHLWVARYILQRVAEKHGYYISYHPKPLYCYNGSGCHVNFSTKMMRDNIDDDNTGLDYINDAIKKLSLKHNEHMEVYGKDNNLRMTGEHETAPYDTFTFGTANRGASVRIGNKTIMDKCGYFEDRRPASNCDPYIVTAKIFQTCVLED